MRVTFLFSRHSTKQVPNLNWPRGYNFFMLNSTENDIFLLINVKIPTIVGILTFISRKNSFLGLSEPEKAEFLDIFIFMSI